MSKRNLSVFTIVFFIFSCGCSDMSDERSVHQEQRSIKVYQKLGYSFECNEQLNSFESSNQDSIFWFSFDSMEGSLKVENIDKYQYLFDQTSETIYEDYCKYLDFDSLNFIASNSDYPLTIYLEGLFYDAYNKNGLYYSIVSPNFNSNTFCVLEISGNARNVQKVAKVLRSFKQYQTQDTRSAE